MGACVFLGVCGSRVILNSHLIVQSQKHGSHERKSRVNTLGNNFTKEMGSTDKCVTWWEAID